MNNLPELTYDEAKSIINGAVHLKMPFVVKFAPDILASHFVSKLAAILVLSRSERISDEVFRNGIEDIINPYGLTPEPEAGITLPPGSVRDHPANDPVSVAAAVIEAQSVDRFAQLKETPGC